MNSPFSETARALRADKHRSNILMFVVGIAVPLLWAGWFVASDVPVFVESITARLESDTSIRSIHVLSAGPVVRVKGVAGEVVTVGDTLVELDQSVAVQHLAETEAELAGYRAELQTLIREIRLREDAISENARAATAAINEARAKLSEASERARLAAENAARSRSLREQGFATESDYATQQSEAEQSRSYEEAASKSLTRVTSEWSLADVDRRANVETLKRDAARLRALVSADEARVERLSVERGRRFILAQASGRLAEFAKLQTGDFLEEGRHIGSIIADGRFKVIATFASPIGVGRVRVGQLARFRLDAFPWIEYGILEVVTRQVVIDPLTGSLRVEGALRGADSVGTHLKYGLTGRLEVEVERLAPAELLLRSIGVGRRRAGSIRQLGVRE